MRLVPSLTSSTALKGLRITVNSESPGWKSCIKIPSRRYGSETEKQPPVAFPSFSTKSGKQQGTNFDGFTANPHTSVYMNTIRKGFPNYDNLPPKILESLNQPANELLDGTSFAIEAVTKAISRERLDTTHIKEDNDSDDNGVLEDCLTPGCLYRLRNCYLSMNVLRDRHFLVNTSKEDIVFSWIHSLSKDEFGSTNMNVCTLSFPQLGFLKQIRAETREKHKKLYQDIKNEKVNPGDEKELNK